MSLRRCPGCHNTIARESYECPICGRSYFQIMFGRMVRWSLIVLVVGWIVFQVAVKRHLQGPG